MPRQGPVEAGIPQWDSGTSAFKSKSGVMVPIRLPPFPLRLRVLGHSPPGTRSAHLPLPPLRPMLDLTGAGPQAFLQYGW